MFEGDSSNQDNSSIPNFSSPYFNITAAPGLGSSSTGATPSATHSATAGTGTAIISTTDTSSPATSPTTANSESPRETPSGSSGLSTGAQIGIGVGVGLVGLAAIAGLVFWYRYLQKKKKVLDATAITPASQYVQPYHDPSSPGAQEVYSPAPVYSASNGAYSASTGHEPKDPVQLPAVASERERQYHEIG